MYLQRQRSEQPEVLLRTLHMRVDQRQLHSGAEGAFVSFIPSFTVFNTLWQYTYILLHILEGKIRSFCAILLALEASAADLELVSLRSEVEERCGGARLLLPRWRR